MKKIGITKAPQSPFNFGVGVEVLDSSVRFYTYNAEGQTIDSRVFDFESKPLGLKELHVQNNIYVVADADGILEPYYNKMLASYFEKSSGYKHITKKNKNVIGQIYIPFWDSSVADCALRLTYSEPGYTCNVPVTDHDVLDYKGFFFSVMPTIKAALEGDRITVQLVDENGADLKRPGVKIYAKTDGGQLVFNERSTDADGKAVFKLLTQGFEPSDVATVEFGFKWVSNVTNVQVQAQ
jgi:hypothetical protein